MQCSISQKEIAKLLDIFINADYEEIIRFKRLGDGKEIVMYLLNEKGVVCKGCKIKGLDLCDHLDADEMDMGDRKITIEVIDNDAEIVEEEEDGAPEDEAMPVSESDPNPVTQKDKFHGEIATLTKDEYGDFNKSDFDGE